jgi:hypothetical protein
MSDTQTLTLYPRRLEQLRSWVPVILPSNEPESRQTSGADHAVGQSSVRDAALMRMTQAGAVMVNWFAVAGELARDWRNDMEGLAGLLGGHLPASQYVITNYKALTAK